MSARELLADLTRQGFRFEPRGDRLHVVAPVGQLTPALRAVLLTHKLALLALLRARAAPPGPGPLVCYFCRGRRFWRSVHGPTVCAACHPPAAAHLVAAWLGEPAAEAVRA